MTERLPAKGSEWHYDIGGRLRSYYSGALGVSYGFPFGLITVEADARVPHPDAHARDPQDHWTTGVGVEPEIPLLADGLLLRGGYAWHNQGSDPYIVTCDGAVETGMFPKPDSPLGDHLASAGLAYTLADHVRIEAAYSHRYGVLETDNVLSERYHLQRAPASLTVMY